MAAASSKGNVSAGTLIALIAALGAASPAITSGEKQAPDAGQLPNPVDLRERIHRHEPKIGFSVYSTQTPGRFRPT